MLLVTDTVDATVRRLHFVLGGLMAGLIALTGVSLTLGPLSEAPDPLLHTVYFGLLALLSLGSTGAYRVIHQQAMKRLQVRSGELRGLAHPSEQVLPEYEKLFMSRAVLTEGPGFFAVVVHLFTGSLAALVVVAGAVALLVRQVPSRERVRDLAQDALREYQGP
jgi:hypothetical protein